MAMGVPPRYHPFMDGSSIHFPIFSSINHTFWGLPIDGPPLKCLPGTAVVAPIDLPQIPTWEDWEQRESFHGGSPHSCLV